ncbi:MAG: hypothetical protein ACM3X5_08475 [Bacillota bacterium]
MDPAHAEGTSWRVLAAAAIPLLLAAGIGSDRTHVHAIHAVLSRPQPAVQTFVRRPAFVAPAATRFGDSDDLRSYVEHAASHLDDPQTMYYVSQALEECRTWAAMPDDPVPPSVMVISSMDMRQAMRAAAGEALAEPCRGFEGEFIDSREVLALLQEAARRGEPHARARMLLFRDIAAPKSDALDEIPALLSTDDPQVVRDVGAFLTRGEVSSTYGGEEVDARTAAIAWELAACDLGYPCGPFSRLVLARCAVRGTCDAYRYDEAIAREEDPARMARAQQLRGELVHALRRHDWSWLGLPGSTMGTWR